LLRSRPEENSDGEGEATDDCDLEGTIFVGSWPDAQTAPSMVVFHTMDDDGERASTEIPISVNNVKPSAHLSVSNQNPTEGDVIILSANMTTDSAFDLENMIYNWDLDTSVDSDGDGNPSNDIDHVGIWLEWKTDSHGTRSVKLTVSDENLVDSRTITILIEEAPFSFADLVSSPLFIILIVLVLAGGGGFAYMQMRKPEDLVEAPPEARRGRRVSMDDAFDDPEFDPFSEDEDRRRVKEQDRDEDGELAWTAITDRPAGLDDGDDNTQLEEQTVEEKTSETEETTAATEPEDSSVLQLTDLDEEYEQASVADTLGDTVLSELLDEDETASEEE